MAHIEIDKREFDDLIGEKLSEEKLNEEASLLGAHWNHIEGPKWDVEVYPNRPDFLSVEGLARAYRGFFEVDTGRKDYDVTGGDVAVAVDSSVDDVRPFIGGAVVRGLNLSRKKINGLIQLQEKLHETMGRRRDKIAIGLHDLSQVEAPFRYHAVEPRDVVFQPLDFDEEMTLQQILDEHDKGQKYGWILDDEDLYPVITDNNGEVLSFPPIINNQLTEVDSGTTDIFIDVTGKDRETVLKVLNIIATALEERGGEIESVRIDGEKMPQLEPEKRELDPVYFRKVSGVEITADEIVERLEMMNYGASVDESSGAIHVEVPAYRTDVMHQYDLIEDVVIAHRYNNIEPELPEVDQIGQQEDIEEFAGTLRDTLLGAGALETHTYILSSREKLFDLMEVEHEDVVDMSNALTEEYSVVRSWMLPSLMEVLKRNRHRRYPQRFFEIAEISELDDSDVGASNRKKMAYVEADNNIDYTDARKVLQLIERDLGVEIEVEESSKGCFRDGRSGDVMLEGEKVGVIGELSDQVTENWGLNADAAGIELDVQKIFERVY